MPDPADARARIRDLEAALAGQGTPERAARERQYLRSDLDHLGVTVPAIRRTTRQLLRDRPPADHDELVALVEACWARPVHELRMAAVEILVDGIDLVALDDLPLLERLLREARTWALVDPLAATVVGALLDRAAAEVQPALDRWSADDDLWIRRASLLAHLGSLRRGEGDFDGFAATADRLLDHEEFFIRKAIGWVLREAGRATPGLVVAWLEPRIGRASGVTVREAVRHLPDADRDRLLAAYGRRRPARAS